MQKEQTHLEATYWTIVTMLKQIMRVQDVLYDSNIESTPKSQQKEIPLSLQVPKDHKEIIINSLKLVILCVFVP